MRLLDRYIGRQLLVAAIFAVTVLSVVLVLGNIFKQLLDLLINQSAPLSLILSFIAYMLPLSFTFTIPWGFQTAVLLVFGRLSAENELTAMRTTGVSIARACVPVWVLAVLLSGVCLWINLDVAPRAQARMKDAFFKVATDNPLAVFGNDKVIDAFPGAKIYVEKTSGKTLTNLFMYELDEANRVKLVMYAREGNVGIEDAPRTQTDGTVVMERQLVLKLRHELFEQRDENHPFDLSRIRQGIVVEDGSIVRSLKELYEKQRKKKGIGALPLDELLESDRPDKFIELNKRIGNALATVALALLALPLAVTAQRKETSVGFAISLVLAMTYYFLIFMADLARHKPALHPALFVWLPNVIFFAVGGYRFWRLTRR
ncbi:MAG: LptF/LptG family permease [Chthoniobacteraceae bacterium]